MLLAVDIGNTSTTLGFFEGAHLVNVMHFPTLREDAVLTDMVKNKLAIFRQVDKIAIASVVPKATYTTCDALQSIYRSAKSKVISHDDIPMPNRYRDPAEVGADRLLGSLAAYHRWGKENKRPLVIIDFGTATVFDCVDKDGTYLGGAIALGIERSAQHLSSIAAQLPNVTLEFPTHVLGRTTKDSMQSGILFGALHAAEGMVRQLREEVFAGEDPIIIGTGGLSELMGQKARFLEHIDPALVLEGIRITSEHLKW
jgi:type III pantothenate kinase